MSSSYDRTIGALSPSPTYIFTLSDIVVEQPLVDQMELVSPALPLMSGVVECTTFKLTVTRWFKNSYPFFPSGGT
jgi:hypothetical protein